MMLRLDGDEASGWQPAQPTSFLKGADFPRFSPDGRWLAYVGRASSGAASEVFVPDGDRFALAAADTQSRLNHVTLMFNFFDELRQMVP
jgi:hypothetical protein